MSDETQGDPASVPDDLVPAEFAKNIPIPPPKKPRKKKYDFHPRDTCGAPTRRGTPCMQSPLPGKTRCKHHGGCTPRGAALPQTKHFRYSLDLPETLIQRYEEAEQDPELLSLRPEVALLTVRMRELAARLHTGEAGSLWLRLGETWNDMQKASAAKDAAKFQVCLTDLGKIIREGNQAEHAWNELVSAIDERTKIASREHARLRDLHQMMTVEQGLTLIAAVASSVRDVLEDQSELNAALSLPEGPERDQAIRDIFRNQQQRIGRNLGTLLNVAPRKANMLPGGTNQP